MNLVGVEEDPAGVKKKFLKGAPNKLGPNQKKRVGRIQEHETHQLQAKDR